MRRAGLLNELIDIYTPRTDIDEFGERKETFVLKYSTRAKVSNDGGGRNVENNEIVYAYSKTFTIRYYVPICDNDRIYWQNKKYRVISTEKRREYNDILVRTELVNE